MINLAYSFIKFNDEIIDSKNMMELTDLTRLLFRDRNITVAVRKFSYFNPSENVMNFSMFWKYRRDITELEGFKHDVYTRFAQNFILDFERYEDMKDVPVLLEQIFLSLEHYRLRRYAFDKRHMIKPLIKKGDDILLRFYKDKYRNEADLLLRRLNIQIIEDRDILNFSSRYFNIITHSTKESIRRAEEIYQTLSFLHDDTVFQMHDMPFNEISAYNRETPFRKDSLDLETAEEDHSEESHKVDTKTDRDAKEANMLGETGNNAAQKYDHDEDNPYEDSPEDFIEKFGQNVGDNTAPDDRSINRYATLELVTPKVRMKNYNKYQALYDRHNDTANKIIGEMNQILNFKQNEVQKNRITGKLTKNPTSQIVSGSHKLFYKENTESREFDAAFTLILDQSFSMKEHLDDAIEGIIIFNNILKTLNIPHRIVSHHEDTFEVMNKHYPNKIYEHMTFRRSKYYYPVSLLDTESSGDNRDGYILSHEIPLIERKGVTDRFIIMFSDGLPSAENYNQDGITDTHEAVSAAERKGITIINVFISKDSDENTVSAIQNIYGSNTIIVSEAYDIIEILPQLLHRLLKSLIL